MSRVGFAELSRADDLIDFQITLSRPRRTNADGTIGELDIPRVAIRLAANDDRLDAKLVTRADHAERDFAAICY